MIVKESDAIEKRCCGPEGCGLPKNDRDQRRYCLGSACMAWRWWSISDGLGRCGLAGEAGELPVFERKRG
jgi:hypothetical protein